MELRRKTKFRILISILIILILSLIYHNYLSSEAYIKRVTRINLPFWTVTNETSMMGVAVIGKFQIPENKVDGFISENNLKKLTDDSDVGIGFHYFLQKKNRIRNKNGDWFQYKDCKSGNVWKILFNSDTGDLWILVQYPDMAGDEPLCNKK